MDGDTFQLQFQRQLLLRSPSFSMKFEQALEKLEAEEGAHAELSQKTTDDATHFSDGYESLGQLDDSKQWTKKINNIVINERFDFSQVSDTPAVEPTSTGQSTSFGFVGTSYTLLQEKEQLKKLKAQSPLHQRGSPSDPAEILQLKNSIPTYRDESLPKVYQCKPIHHAVKYNGAPKDWTCVDAAIKQHYGQCSCQHLTNPEFLEKYLEGGYELCITEFPYLCLTYPQLISDNTAFNYGLSSIMSDMTSVKQPWMSMLTFMTVCSFTWLFSNSSDWMALFRLHMRLSTRAFWNVDMRRIILEVY
jgi:hypothetical protein